MFAAINQRQCVHSVTYKAIYGEEKHWQEIDMEEHLVYLKDTVEGSKGIADCKEGDEDQQAVIDPQCEGQLDVQHCSHICTPHCRPKEACHDVQYDQQIVCLSDPPVPITIKQHACRIHTLSGDAPIMRLPFRHQL